MLMVYYLHDKISTEMNQCLILKFKRKTRVIKLVPITVADFISP